MIVQLQVLNKILSTNDFSVVINNGLTDKFFPNYTSEFNFIYSHYQTYGQVPDLATFLNSFPNFEVLSVSEPDSFLVEELYKTKNENLLVNTFNHVKDLLLKGKTDEALELFTSASQKVNSERKLDAVNIIEDISRYDSYVDKCNNFNKYYLSTGFKELDESLGGGIDRLNSYFVISARPGIGKTLVMIKFALAAIKEGLRVGFYEGEMEVNKIAGRFDTLNSHLSNGAITHGNQNVANQYKTYLDKLSKSGGQFYVLTRDMVPGDKVTVDVLEGFVDKYKLDILFVDQISLLDSTARYTKSFELVAGISKKLKSLQVRKQIPIVVASQLNRDATDEKKSTGTENLSSSDRIGQDASEVICLSKHDSVLQIDIAKARDGAKEYRFKYDVDFDKGQFTFLPEDDPDEYEIKQSDSDEDVF